MFTIVKLYDDSVEFPSTFPCPAAPISSLERIQVMNYKFIVYDTYILQSTGKDARKSSLTRFEKKVF
jgi:hypothetical protein